MRDSALGQRSRLVLLLEFLIGCVVVPVATPSRLWGQVYLDSETACRQIVIRNDDMELDDTYGVYSDSWGGTNDSPERIPAECAVRFNLGDRLAMVQIVRFSCEPPVKSPRLDIYDDCESQREGPILAHFNCSKYEDSHLPVIFKSSTSCISIYHYRGHQKSGYYFELQVIASQEVIAFPAGGIAAIFMACVITVLLITKLVCCLSGYENKLPDVDPEAKQSILEVHGFQNKPSTPSSPIHGASSARIREKGDLSRTASVRSTVSGRSQEPHSSTQQTPPRRQREVDVIPPPPRPTFSGQSQQIHTPACTIRTCTV